MIPVIWFENSIELSENTRDQLERVALIADVCLLIPFALLCSGGFWVVLSICFYIYAKYHQVFKKFFLIISSASKKTAGGV
jgi:hypothetical protein